MTKGEVPAFSMSLPPQQNEGIDLCELCDGIVQVNE